MGSFEYQNLKIRQNVLIVECSQNPNPILLQGSLGIILLLEFLVYPMHENSKVFVQGVFSTDTQKMNKRLFVFLQNL